jgi:GR25 family glycosyltransferase involved in LPS biosynthesis
MCKKIVPRIGTAFYALFISTIWTSQLLAFTETTCKQQSRNEKEKLIWVPNVEIVTLEKDRARLKDIELKLKANSSLMRRCSITFHLGSYGPRVNLRNMFEAGKISPSSYLSVVTPRFVKGHFMTPGAIGCALSHIEVWKEVASSNHPAIILEDDVSIAPQFDYIFPRILRDLPLDFDILYFADLVKSSESQLGVKLSSFLELLKGEAWGTYAYMISSKGAKRLLNGVFPLKYQIDSYILSKRNESNMKVFRSRIDLVTTDNSPNRTSNVQLNPKQIGQKVQRVFHHLNSLDCSIMNENIFRTQSNLEYIVREWCLDDFADQIPYIQNTSHPNYVLAELRMKLKILDLHGGYFFRHNVFDQRIVDMSKGLEGLIAYETVGDVGRIAIPFVAMQASRKGIAQIIEIIDRVLQIHDHEQAIKMLFNDLELLCSTFHTPDTILLFPAGILVE